MKYQFKSHNQTGFSLVETLVAITILLIVVTGPLKISTNTAQSTSFSSEQVEAFLLAQEGLELAQKARDDLMLDYFASDAGNPWGDFIDVEAGDFETCFEPTGCGLELDDDDSAGELKTPVDCANSFNKCRLYFNPNGDKARYTYIKTSGGIDNEDTKYTRVIKMSESGDQVRVISTVTWYTGSLRDRQQVEAETYLFNVYDTP